MVWTKKAAAPAYANLLEKVEAVVTGGPDAWLMPWFDLAPGNINMDVVAFCALGPPDPVAFTALDFLGFVGGSRLGGAISSVSLGDKIGQWMMGKLFEAYCEQSVAATSGCGPNLSSWNTTGDWINLAVPSNTIDIKLGNMTGGKMQEARRSSVLGTGGINWGYALNHGASGGDELIHWSQTASGETPPHTEQFCSIRCNANVPTFIQFCGTSAYVETFTPTPIVQPSSAVAPAPGVYTTIAHLGAELDKIENKLHWVLSMAADRVIEQTAPLVADSLITVGEPDEDIALADDVSGFILTVDNIPNSVDATFPTPQQLHRLGRVWLGNGTAWCEPIEITVTPMLVLKTSTFQTVARVQLNAPATGELTTLVKAPPAG